MANDIYGTLSPTDLTGFAQSVQASDPYGIAGQALGAFQPDMSTWSAGTQGATAFGKAFLSSILGNYARQNTANQLSSVVQSLPSLTSNPYGTAVPEGVDSSAYNILRGTSALNQAQMQAASASKKSDTRMDLLKTIFGEGVKTGSMSPQAALEGIETGKLPFGQEVDASKNPNSNQYKFNKDIADIERKYTETLLTGTAAKEAMNINRASTNILEAIKKDNPLAAATAIFEFAKLQDPAGTVREADEMRVSDPGGPLGQLARTFNEIQSKGKLTAEAKRSMRELVPLLQKNTFDQYDQIKGGFLDAATQYGADPSRIQYVKPTDLSSYLQEPVTDTTTNPAAAELARRGLNPDGTPMTSSSPKKSISIFGNNYGG